MELIKGSAFILLWFCLFFSLKYWNDEEKDDVVNGLDQVEVFVQNAGYECKVYEVQTEDGYILKMHRILLKDPKEVGKKGPVFLMHGLFGTAADYVLTGPETALAYLLADQGYDVWMGNARGSKHSMKHKTLNPDSNEFWNFSWHEIGFYDLSAMMDYIIKQTNFPKVFFIGTSQGTTSLMVLLSTRPEYNQKIHQAHLLLPVVFMGFNTCPLIKNFETIITNLYNYGLSKLPPLVKLVASLFDIFCPNQLSGHISACENILGFIFGHKTENFNIDMKTLSLIPSHASPTVSIKQLVHYLQIARSGKFQQFNYGQRLNLEHYNTSAPPDYKLTNVKVPIYIHHIEEDRASSEIDLEHLKSILLPNIRHYRLIPNWSHMDLVYGKDARTVLYEDIVKILAE